MVRHSLSRWCGEQGSGDGQPSQAAARRVRVGALGSVVLCCVVLCCAVLCCAVLGRVALAGWLAAKEGGEEPEVAELAAKRA
jgi:hypothetical protein